jgi:hypothetical protein
MPITKFQMGMVPESLESVAVITVQNALNATAPMVQSRRLISRVVALTAWRLRNATDDAIGHPVRDELRLATERMTHTVPSAEARRGRSAMGCTSTAAHRPPRHGRVRRDPKEDSP